MNFKLDIETSSGETMSLIVKWSEIMELCWTQTHDWTRWPDKTLNRIDDTVASMRQEANRLEVIANTNRALKK